MRAILGRDFVAEGSRDRAFALRTVAGGAAALLLAGRALSTLGGIALDEAGARAFASITKALFLLLAATVPALMAPSLLEERRRGTLDLLLASPIGVTGLVAGKLLSRLGTAATFAAAALPPLSLALLFGGTPWSRFLDAAAGLLGTALEAGALGLLVTCAARRTATAAILAYLLPALHWGAVPALRDTGAPFLAAPWWTILEGTTPMPFLEGSLPGAGMRFLLFALLAAAVAIPAAGWLLLREAAPTRAAPRSRFRSPLGEGIRRRLFGRNPVAWKESLFLDTGWSRLLFLLLTGLLLAGEATFVVLQGRGLWDAERNQAWLVAAFAGLAGAAAVQGASTASAEKNGPTFEVLRTTPLTPREITGGKLAGLCGGLALLMAVPLLHVLLSVPAGYLTAGAAAATAVAAVFVVGNAAVHGLAWGFASRSGTAAAAGAAAFVAFAHASFGVLCPALFGALIAKAVRKSSLSMEFLGIVALPALLCGPPWYLLFTVPLSITAWTPLLSRGPYGPAPLNLVGLGLLLGMTTLFAVYDARRMPALLDREIFRLRMDRGPEDDGPDRPEGRRLLAEAQASALAAAEYRRLDAERRARERDAAEENARGGRP